MSAEEVLVELKNKQLPTFGTLQERKDRLKKANGIEPSKLGNYAGVVDEPPADYDYEQFEEPGYLKQPLQQYNNNINPQAQQQPGAASAQQQAANNYQKKSSVVDNIERMQKQREDRRLKMEEQKEKKKQREFMNEANGRLIDADFDMMMEKFKLGPRDAQPHQSTQNMKISVCVRKRPIFSKESQAGEMDAVSAANPKIIVHECKFKVDGITKFIENHDFSFENTFSHLESNEQLYKAAIQPNIHFPFNRGVVTCFAYGQTGSGKTFTMKGSNEAAISDLFALAKTQYADKSPRFYMSFFEIYGGKLFDLLNGRSKLTVLEDKNQKIQI